MKISVLLVSLMILVSCGSTPSPRDPAAAVTSATTGFDGFYNAFRREQGLGAMRQNAALARAAQAHAQDMNDRRYFSHSSRGGPNGATFIERAASSGCMMRAGAENIAQGQRNAQEVFDAWLNSPGHRRNLEGQAYTIYGLGRAGDYWVMKLASAC